MKTSPTAELVTISAIIFTNKKPRKNLNMKKNKNKRNKTIKSKTVLTAQWTNLLLELLESFVFP